MFYFDLILARLVCGNIYTPHTMIKTTCKSCRKPFLAKPVWIKNGYGKYCSRDCASLAKRKGKEVMCDTCKHPVYKQLKAIMGSKSGKFFCSKSCQTKWRNSEFSDQKHPNYKHGKHSYRRKLTHSGQPVVCRLCQISDIRILAVHHIDEDRTNHSIENLAWLCHNCHLLVHHYEAERERFMAAIV